MKTVIVLAIGLSSMFVAANALRAQAPTPSASRLAFEVASIKENTSPTFGGSAGFRPGGTFVATNIPLSALLRLAFRTEPALTAQRVVGVPGWADSTRYDVTAKVAGDVPRDVPSLYQHQPEYLRALLEDRFAFKGHMEMRDMPIYALTVAPGGLKMTASTIDCGAPGNGPKCGIPIEEGRLRSQALQMVNLLGTLTGAAGRPVIDRTGLEGRFDVDLQWSPGNSTEAARAPLDVLVVEHLERPQEN